MGNDFDFGTGPFVPISARDQQIVRRAAQARLRIRQSDRELILRVVRQVGKGSARGDEAFEDRVLDTLNIDHGLDEAKWRLPVQVVMAKLRADRSA